MYSGIHSLKPTEEVVYVAWTGPITDVNGTLVDPSTLPPELLDELKKQLWNDYKYIPVIVEDKVATGAYEGYCKTRACLSLAGVSSRS